MTRGRATLRLLAALLCALALGLLAQGAGAGTAHAGAAVRQGGATVTQQIRYRAPAAGAVLLVWGVDGWAALPELERPAGTVLVEGVMHSPMARDGEEFVAAVQLPRGAELSYGFRITALRDGTRIESLWHGSERFRAVAGAPIVVASTLDLAYAHTLPGAAELWLYALLAGGLLLVTGVVLWRAPGLRYRGPQIARRATLLDLGFLAALLLLSLGLHVGRLGFSSDDWAFLAAFAQSQDQSLGGLFWANYGPHTRMRPAQVLYFALLFWLFGAEPLGYHLVNAAVLLCAVLLLYLALRELGLPRLVTLSTPAIYALLPHYATDRFWVAAFQAGLSMALYFLSLYADLRTLRAGAAARWGWKLLSLGAMLVAGLAYEVVLPLFLLNALLIWWLGRPRAGGRARPLGLGVRAALAGSGLALLAALLGFKALVTTRLDTSAGVVERTLTLAYRAVDLNPDDLDRGLNIRQALTTSYGELVFGMPAAVWSILRERPALPTLITAAAIGLLVCGYLLWAGATTPRPLPDSRLELLRPLAWGTLLFGLGYAIFLSASQVQFAATGIGNRTAIAAAVGVAFSLVGGLGWASAVLMSGAWRLRLYCLLVGLLCAGGFLLIDRLAGYWAEAYQRQREVLAAIERRFPALPDGSTLLLDGVCPYAGPAIVFESHWDLAGALQVLYRNPSLRADVVTPNLHIDDRAITTRIYDMQTAHPYERLFVYHAGQDVVFPLPDAAAARRYFATYNPDYRGGCPPGRPGFGVLVF